MGTPPPPPSPAPGLVQAASSRGRDPHPRRRGGCPPPPLGISGRSCTHGNPGTCAVLRQGTGELPPTRPPGRARRRAGRVGARRAGGREGASPGGFRPRPGPPLAVGGDAFARDPPPGAARAVYSRPGATACRGVAGRAMRARIAPVLGRRANTARTQREHLRRIGPPLAASAAGRDCASLQGHRRRSASSRSLPFPLSASMVRKGSSVRVRQRACRESPARERLFVIEGSRRRPPLAALRELSANKLTLRAPRAAVRGGHRGSPARRLRGRRPPARR